MAHSDAIDRALIARLGGDATLLSYAVNGCYFDEAPPNMTKFVIVSLVSAFDEGLFNDRAYEDCLFLVEARGLDASAQVRSAAQRIDELLDPNGQGVTFTADGYVLTSSRQERIRDVEVDDFNPDLRWYRRGGHYRIHAAPTQGTP